MERLTKTINGVVVYIGPGNEFDNGLLAAELSNDQIRTVMRRLADYEDTGLEPEAINAIKLTLMGKSIAEIKEFEGVPIKHLRELAQAEKDGRLVALPCKVGDTVYQIDDERIYESEIKRIIYDTNNIAFDERAIMGETVFLTREEAEAALAAEEEANDD